MKELKAFTVVKSKWTGMGKHMGHSCLLNTQGNMCCLGFAALEMGIDEKELYGVSFPDNVESLLGSIFGRIATREEYIANHDEHELTASDIPTTAIMYRGGAGQLDLYIKREALSRAAAYINDDDRISVDTKIDLLTKLFAKYDITVNWED